MEITEGLEKVSGGLKAAKLEDGKYVLISDKAHRFETEEEANTAIDEMERNFQIGFPPKGNKHHKEKDCHCKPEV